MSLKRLVDVSKINHGYLISIKICMQILEITRITNTHNVYQFSVKIMVFNSWNIRLISSNKLNQFCLENEYAEKQKPSHESESRYCEEE